MRVVDCQVQIFPTDPPALNLAITGEAVVDLSGMTELFDIG